MGWLVGLIVLLELGGLSPGPFSQTTVAASVGPEVEQQSHMVAFCLLEGSVLSPGSWSSGFCLTELL